MASPGNPVTAALARQVVSRLAQNGPSGGAGGPGGPGQSDQAGQQIAQQLAELQGADPGTTMKMLQQIKSVMVAMYPRTAFSIPGVARNIAQAQKYIDNALKECEQAQATAQTVQNPIANGAGQPQQNQPDAQGGGLQQFAMGAQ